MNQDQKQEIAAFRYGLISKVVNRLTPLEAGEITAFFKDVSKQTLNIPYSTRKSISVRSLERYKSLYEAHGLDGLMPSDMPKRGVTSAPREIFELAAELRKERPERSVEQIIFTLEQEGNIKKDELSRSTLSRYLRSQDLSRKQLLKTGNSGDSYKRFETSHPGEMWQSDYKHAIYLPDPANPKARRKTKLCCILDDFSRYIVHGQFYWDEKLPTLEDCFKKAILKHGIPEQYYCDNGSAFSSKHLANICARLGVRLSHSKPYRPAGRGKIERFFQFIDTSFIPEAYSLVEKKEISTLEELNRFFQLWLEGYYHQRKHGSTRYSPQERLNQCTLKLRQLPVDTLMRMFFIGEQRQVDKTGCISLNGTLYDAGPELAMSKVEVRFDPFELRSVEIWHLGVFYGHAKVLNTRDNFNNFSSRHREYPTALQTMKKQTETVESTQNELPSFMDAAKSNMLEAYEQQQISYFKEENHD